MVERGSYEPDEKQLKFAEISMDIRGYFEEAADKPQELKIKKIVLDDIIALRQQQYNVRVARERYDASGSVLDRGRFDDESFFQEQIDRRVLQRVNTDDEYNDVYEKLAKDVDKMEIFLIKSGTENHGGATTRELKRIRRYVRNLDTMQE